MKRPNEHRPHRRLFLKSMSVTAATGLSLNAWQAQADEGTSLVILHTNDTHSHLEPLPQNHPSRSAGLGGVARRASLINQIRARHRNVLLLDSGDIFQGTPYFNLFGGEIEFKVMSAMGYDVSTLGNHEFDNGVDGFVSQLPHADFEFVSANYDVSRSQLADHVKPYTIKRFGSLRVGIFGLGIDFAGLVLKSAHQGVEYQDPLNVARATVEELRNKGCQFIVCLSHLGHQYKADRVGDVNLAAEVSGIDLVLGGHTHTFLDAPEIVSRPGGVSTMVHQVGYAGIRLGRIDINFSNDDRPVRQVAGHYSIGHAKHATPLVS